MVYDFSDRLSKLDEMIVAGERTKPLYDSIPDTIARLESLQELHMQAGEFSNSLLQLDSLQTQLSLQLANNLSLLQVSHWLTPLGLILSFTCSKPKRSSKTTRQTSTKTLSLCSKELRKFKR